MRRSSRGGAEARSAPAGSQAGSHTDERLPGSTDFNGQPTRTPPRSRTDLNGPGCLQRNLRIRRLRVRVPPSARRPGQHDCQLSLLSTVGYAVDSRARTRQPRPEGWQPRGGQGRNRGQDQARSAADHRAISVPLTPVKEGLLRSFAGKPRRRSGLVQAPNGTDSQADSAGSIPVTRSIGGPAHGLLLVHRSALAGHSSYPRAINASG